MSILSIKEVKGDGHMKLWKKLALAFGIILWVGALSPEIFVKSGSGCIFDESGNELDASGADEFMEAFFYDETPVKVNYRFAILDYWGGIK
jgi:hypothetical protein